MDKIAQNTRSFVRQFRQVLMGLYGGQYDISKISIEPDLDGRIESPGDPIDTGDRILTVKYNIFRKVGKNKKDKMKRIFKYMIPEGVDRFELELPIFSEILTFQSQKEQFYIWAIIEDEEDRMEKRYFRILGTGRPLIIGKYKIRSYIGTAQIENGELVFHLFEIYFISTKKEVI